VEQIEERLKRIAVRSLGADFDPEASQKQEKPPKRIGKYKRLKPKSRSDSLNQRDHKAIAATKAMAESASSVFANFKISIR